MTFDVIIVGKGLVGSCLALMLADTQLKIAIIDGVDHQPLQLPPRPLALNNSSSAHLAALQLWDKLSPVATPIKQVHVSSRGVFGSVRINAAQHQLETLGFVLPLNQVVHQLYQAVNQAPTITTICPATITRTRLLPDGAEVTVKQPADTRRFKTRLLIAADGQHSAIRQQIGITATGMDQQYRAITTTIKLMRPHHNMAYERFTPTGTLALLPLANQQCGVVWTSAERETCANFSTATFLMHCQQQFGYRLGRWQHMDAIQQVTLAPTIANEQSRGSCLLLGNSAHSLHPVAAQGFNLSLNDAACLAQHIKRVKVVDFRKVLPMYQQKRQKKQRHIIQMNQLLLKLFHQQSKFPAICKTMAFLSIEHSLMLKQKLIDAR